MTDVITRAMLVPSNAVLVTKEGANAEVYTFLNNRGMPSAKAYKGRSMK
jgi:hypothetical protein